MSRRRPGTDLGVPVLGKVSPCGSSGPDLGPHPGSGSPATRKCQPTTQSHLHCSRQSCPGTLDRQRGWGSTPPPRGQCRPRAARPIPAGPRAASWPALCGQLLGAHPALAPGSTAEGQGQGAWAGEHTPASRGPGDRAASQSPKATQGRHRPGTNRTGGREVSPAPAPPPPAHLPVVLRPWGTVQVVAAAGSSWQAQRLPPAGVPGPSMAAPSTAPGRAGAGTQSRHPEPPPPCGRCLCRVTWEAARMHLVPVPESPARPGPSQREDFQKGSEKTPGRTPSPPPPPPGREPGADGS